MKLRNEVSLNTQSESNNFNHVVFNDLKHMIIRVCLIMMLLSSVMCVSFCSSSTQQKITATASEPVVINPIDLPGKISDYDIYTYEWVSKAMSVTSDIRGLEFTRDLYFFITTTNELPSLIGNFSQDNEEIMEGFYRQIGFLAEDEHMQYYDEDNPADYSGIAGFYGIGTNTFVIVSDAYPPFNPYSPSRFTDVVLVHELTHALQDMNFNLSSNVSKYENNTDALMSFKAILEGDATLTQYLFLIEDNPALKDADDESKKDVIRRISDRFRSSGYGGIIDNTLSNYNLRKTLFIYHHGLSFASQLYLVGGYDLVNKALSESVPVSTEQIMHPLKYINNDLPSSIEMPTLSEHLKSNNDGSWNLKYEDTLGEFNIYLLIDKYLDSRYLLDRNINASTVANGWDGDRVEYFMDYSTDDDALVWISAWDSEKDAMEFMEAYAHIMVKKRNNNRLNLKLYDSENIVWEDTQGNISSIRLLDKTVFILEDVPSHSFEGFLDKVLSSSKIILNN